MGNRILAIVLCILIVIQPYVNIQRGLVYADSKPAESVETPDTAEMEGVPEETVRDIATLQEIIKGKPGRVSIDVFRLLEQVLIPFQKPREIRAENIGIDVLNYWEKPIQSSYLKAQSGFEVSESNSGFQIKYQDKPFIKFRIPVQSLVFVDHFVVFTERSESAQKAKLRELFIIDLDYFSSALGRTEIPIFRMLVDAPGSLQGNRDGLRVGEMMIPKEVVRSFSEAQQLAWNVTVNLVDPKTHEQGVVLADSFTAAFEKAMDVQGDQIAEQADRIDALKKNQTEIRKRLQESFDAANPGAKALEVFSQDAEFKKYMDATIHSIGKNVVTQRKLMARLGHLFSRLSFPQPLGAPKVMQALGLIATGFKGREFQGTSSLREGFTQLVHSKGFKWSIGLASGMAIGLMYPQELAQFFWSALDISRVVLDTAIGKSLDIAYQAEMAFSKTLQGFAPHVLYQAYVAGGQLRKTAIGLSAILATLYVTLGVPHIAINVIKLVRDFRTIDIDAYQAQYGRYKGWARAFIDRQNQEQKNYLELLTDYQAHLSNHDRTFTPEDEREVDETIERIENGKRIKRMLNKLKLSSLVKKYQTRSQREIDTLGKAIRHFLFSICSFTNAGSVYPKIWNAYFGLRSFVWKPTLWLTMVIYPNFFATVTAREGHLIWPTEVNGGYRLFWEQSFLKFQKQFDADYVEAVKRWEDRIIDVEQAIQTHAVKETFRALVEYMGTNKDLRALYEAGGIHILSDKAFEGMNSGQKHFFRRYLTTLSNRAMESFLKDVIESSSGFSVEGMDVQKMKEQSLSHLESIKLSVNVAEGYVLRQDRKQIFEESARSVEETPLWQQYKEEFFTKKTKQLDPTTNKQVYRMMAVSKQLQNPKAVARAVRAMMASNLIDKPQELLFTFLCMAAIQDGILQPIQDEMFGPNSWFYLSKALFTNGFIYGVISGVLADIWGKLQRDLIHEGHFDNIPEGADAKKGYTAWLYKQTFKNPRNSWWANQKHNLAIVWANMPAALTNYFIIQLITMGRFDLDMYIVGYLTVFLTPWSGFNAKLEQGFELAANFDLKYFREKLRSHPKTQEYLARASMKRRLWWNFFFKCYENVVGYMLVNFESMSTPKFGSRSLSRILFAGKTATFHVHKALSALSATKIGSLPGINHALRACDYLITNNFTDL